GSGITYSSVLSSALGALDTALDAFAAAMIDGLELAGDAIRAARTSAQRFAGTDPAYDDYRDVAHFAALVRDGVPGDDPLVVAIRDRAQGVINAVATAVDAESHSTELTGAHGLTAWIPDCTFFNNHARKYGDLRF